MRNPYILAAAVVVLAGVVNAASLPTSGSVVIENDGVYTVDEDCLLDSILVSTPQGSADSRAVTTFDLTATPGRIVSVTGANPQFNVTNHYCDVAFLGGTWNFTGDFYLGNENSSTLGRDAFRRLFIQDGAEISANKMLVNYGTGGSEMHVTNATVSVAQDIVVQQASAMTTNYDPDNCGKLVVTAGGKVSVGNTLYVQYPYTSSNMRQSGLLSVSGTGAEVSAKTVCVGDAPLSRARCGGRVLVNDGGSLSSSYQFRLGCSAYAYNPELSDSLIASNAVFSGVNVYVGYGDGVTNARAEFTNSTVSATGDFYCGYGANSASNSVLFSKCANPALIDDFAVGFGAGSHDNFIGFYDCGTIAMPSGKTWFCGSGDGSYGNVLYVSNTVITTDRQLAAGGGSNSTSNEVVVAGPQAAVIFTVNQRDPIASGRCNRFRVTDGARFAVGNTSLWLFKSGYDSELVLEKGGTLTYDVGSSLSVVVGKITSSGVTSGNRLVSRDGGIIDINTDVEINGLTNSIVVSNAKMTTRHLKVGVLQNNSSTGDIPSDGCRLDIQGTNTAVTINRHLQFVSGSNSALRFELSGSGYSWPDDPDRVAPIELVTSGYTVTISSDTILEASFTKMNASAYGRPIPLVTSKTAMSIDATALANANAVGSAARNPYAFSVSEDSKTLYVTVETRARGLVVTVE